MKTLLVSISLFFSCMLLQAQNKTINDFYKNHRKESNAVGMRLPGWLLRAGIDIATRGREARLKLKPLRPFLRRLNNVRLLASEDIPKRVIRKFMRDIQGHNFSTLACIKDEGVKVDILVCVKERGTKKNRHIVVKNILLVVQEEVGLTLFTVSGRWRMKQVKRLLKERKMHQTMGNDYALGFQ